MPREPFVDVRPIQAVEKRVFAISVLCAVVYLVTISRQPFPGSIVIKGAAVTFLAVIALRLLSGKDRWLMAGALFLSAAGDVLIELGDRYFLFALGAFALAHVLYPILFVGYWRTSGIGRGGDRYALVAATVLYSGVLLWRVWPGLGRPQSSQNLKVPVTIYIALLTIMVITAVLAPFVSQLIGFGAVLFLISDSLLALTRFRQPVPFAPYLIWATYYLAQFGLAFGFFREGRRSQAAQP
jgi:uncharacterized membrane protein YhhN